MNGLGMKIGGAVHACKLLLYLNMRQYPLVVFLLILCFAAKGQDPALWLDATTLENKGYYKNHGLKETKVVIGLSIENKDSVFKKSILKLHNPHINYIYLINSKNDTIYQTGDQLPFHSRPEYFWDFVLPIQSLGNSVDSFKLVFDNVGDPLFYSLELYSEREFQRIRSNENFVFGAVFSFSIGFIIIFVLLGFFNKDNTRYYFALFILSGTLWVYNINGVLFQMIWPDNAFLQNASRPFFSSTTIGTLVLYFLAFYKDYINRYVRYALVGFIWYLILRAVIIIITPGFFESEESKKIAFFVTTPLLIIGLFCIVFYLFWLLKFKQVLLHTISITIYFFFIIKVILKLFGINMMITGAHDEYFSTAVHFIIMTLFSIANIQEYRRNKRKRVAEKIAEADWRKTETGEKIVEAQENERNAIAKNIHDQVGGILAAMKIKLQTLKLVNKENQATEELIQLLNMCNGELHKIVDDLASPEFMDRDLSDVLNERMQMMCIASEINVHYNKQPLNINNKLGVKIYRIICELITNSIKHAYCSDIELKMEIINNNIHIDFSDNGVGMQTNTQTRGRGLQNIKSRIIFLNGNMQFSSHAGETKYLITIPIS
jgi:signal transduction histidine kinase